MNLYIVFSTISLCNILLLVNLTSQISILFMSKHTTSLLLIHQRVSLPIIIK